MRAEIMKRQRRPFTVIRRGSAEEKAVLKAIFLRGTTFRSNTPATTLRRRASEA
jgi:hypothetical protein